MNKPLIIGFAILAGVLITSIVTIIITLTGSVIPGYVWFTLAAITGVPAGIIIFLLVSPLFKEQLLHDPDNPDKLGMFVEVGTGRSVAIDYGNSFYVAIDGDLNAPYPIPIDVEKGKSSWLSRLWMLYRSYIWWATKLHVYVPFFTEPKTYDLFPRYKPVTIDGKRDYVPVEKNDDGYRSNHVRTSPFTWIFKFTGVDLQTVPFTVIGSIQMLIDKEKVKEALYVAESWNILLDQAIYAVIRAIVLSKLNIDMVLGTVNKDLWADQTSASGAEAYTDMVAKLIFEGLMGYRFKKPIVIDGREIAEPSLADLGIKALRVDITDFKDELTEDERAKLRSPVLGRQEGRARDLSAQGIAQEQRHMAAVLKELDPDLRESILSNRALVDAVSKGGTVETLLTSLTKKFLNKES